MPLTMIDKLRNLSPEDRPLLMQETYDRNMDFFKRKHQGLLSLVTHYKSPYAVNITANFLDIIDEQTGKLAHPEVGLDLFAEMMGEWTHDAWVDLFNFRVVVPEQYPIHNRPIKQFYREMMCQFPEYPIRFAQRKINLKELPDGKRFSPPVIFLGVFHGLHIDYFLSRTELAYLLFVEPDPGKFEVSCYFLDYEAIRERFGTFLMSVGPDIHTVPIRSFFSNYHVSRHMWVRVLPGYQHERTPYLIESFKMHQTSLASVIFPIDYEILGLRQGADNLKQHLPLLTKKIKLSRKSKIVIVATGPSLNYNLDWLLVNADKVIIFAVHSAVKPLRSVGIKPDFQFSMETFQTEEGVENLCLYKDIPLVAYVKTPTTFMAAVDTVLLCGTADKASSVNIAMPLSYLAPSTTNLVFSFACFCRPAHIYLVGCDFGFFSLNESHAKNSIYKEDQGKTEIEGVETQLRDMSQIIVEANFSNSESVQSTPFLSHARIAIEECYDAFNTRIRLFNLSDGAKIRGARPKRAESLRLQPYRVKEKDVRLIRQAFEPAREGKNWYRYKKSGNALVLKLKKQLIAQLEVEEFHWCEFNRIVDFGLQTVVNSIKEDENDRRLDIFVRYLLDLLSMWYSTLIFFDDKEKAGEVYRVGLEKLKVLINDLQWPVDEM